MAFTGVANDGQSDAYIHGVLEVYGKFKFRMHMDELCTQSQYFYITYSFCIVDRFGPILRDIQRHVGVGYVKFKEVNIATRCDCITWMIEQVSDIRCLADYLASNREGYPWLRAGVTGDAIKLVQHADALNHKSLEQALSLLDMYQHCSVGHSGKFTVVDQWRKRLLKRFRES